MFLTACNCRDNQIRQASFHRVQVGFAGRHPVEKLLRVRVFKRITHLFPIVPAAFLEVNPIRFFALRTAASAMDITAAASMRAFRALTHLARKIPEIVLWTQAKNKACNTNTVLQEWRP
jgi:hypothetical protein